MKTRAFAILILLSGCGQHPATEVENLFSDFEAEAASRGSVVSTAHVTYEFFRPEVTVQIGGQEMGTLAGQCIVEQSPYKLRLNERFWEKASLADRERLVFHELGHCVLGRGHTSNLLSLMHPNFAKVKNYTERRTEYLDELFFPQK